MTEETAAFANALIFDGVSTELREGCVRVAAGTIVEVGEGPEPGDRVIDCRGRTVIPGARRLAGALGRGFTIVRDPGGGDAGLARAVREGWRTRRPG